MAKLVQRWADDSGIVHDSKAEAIEADANIALNALMDDHANGLVATEDDNEGGLEICTEDVLGFIMTNREELVKILTNVQVELTAAKAEK